MNRTLPTLPHPAASAVLRAVLLALLAAWPAGCVVNPVPTPGSAGSAMGNDNQAADAAQADTGKLSDTEASGGMGDADSAVDVSAADSAADATASSDADGGDAADVSCCPLDPPGCDCVSVGGSPGPSGCVKVCDSAPVGWKKLVDKNGCPYWQTGPQSCMILPVKCADNPPSFPAFTKVCQQDADCAYVLHQSDCCGNATAIGVWKEVQGAFASAEAQCRGQYPACGCAAQAPKGEDGKTSASGSFGVACKSGQCQTFAND